MANSQFAIDQDEVDADRIVDIYHHKQLAVAGNEFLAMDFVHQQLREFATTLHGENACTPDDRHCDKRLTVGNVFLSKGVHAYWSYLRSQFRYTTMDGADYLASLLRMGLIVQAIIAFCYLIPMLLATERIVGYAIARSGGFQ